MKNVRYRAIGLMLLIGALAALALLSGIQMMGVTRAAADASADTQTCQELALRIGRLRNRPSLAQAHEADPNELNHRVEQAVAKTHLPPASLTSIRPQAARRVENSVYLEKPTELALREITLAQLVSFLRTLMNDDSHLRIGSLRLTTPRQESPVSQGTEQWSVELTISYLIYAPPTGLEMDGETSP